MGFATPFLSLSRLSLKVFPTALPAHLELERAPEEASQALLFSHEHSGLHAAYPQVFTMRKSRNRRRSDAPRASAKATPDAIQRALPLQETAPAQAPRILKIVQREPRHQPECLMISGRMADVCAALERMAHNERPLKA